MNKGKLLDIRRNFMIDKMRLRKVNRGIASQLREKTASELGEITKKIKRIDAVLSKLDIQ